MQEAGKVQLRDLAPRLANVGYICWLGSLGLAAELTMIDSGVRVLQTLCFI